MPRKPANKPRPSPLAVREAPMPVASAAALAAGFAADPFAFFLDSGIVLPGLGRYAFLGSRPFLILTVKGRTIRERQGGRVRERQGNAFAALDEALARYRIAGACPVPFATGAVGFLGYDLCHHVERLPRTAVDDIGLPDLHFAFYDRAVALDLEQRRCFLLANAFGPDEPLDAKLDDLARRLTALSPPAGPLTAGQIASNFERDDYLRAIIRAKDYIAAGDIFQVNLSQRFHARYEGRPWDLYARLRSINPAPFAAYLGLDGDDAVVCASPERFLRVDGRRVQTRPIKGTRPRGATPDDDRRQARELLASAKDNAELAMIVDLERNDLGRVCEYGSVVVTEARVLESYPTVHHLVATVEGTLHERFGVVDLLKASFPGGSITGAPKIRAMEIIDELEPTQRSVYTGALGYLGFDGRADLNIVIRTFLCRGRDLFFQMGGGLVADSEPEAEYDETLHKARALMETIRQ